MAATADAADDRSPLIQALTWFLLLAGFFSICARIVTKYFLRRAMEWDDKLMLGAEADYAGTPLLLLSLALIKWSLSAFVRQLSPNKDIEYRVDQGLSFIVGLWLVSAAVIGLFQCRLPKPWDYIQSHNCIDRNSSLTPKTIYSSGDILNKIISGNTSSGPASRVQKLVPKPELNIRPLVTDGLQSDNGMHQRGDCLRAVSKTVYGKH
ncbi:hypothetical protein PG991_011414 [Apiospora marii]|uniref:Uncharacterized protein n=1 Tax=Apiospora marii TaxID=335849 RepID=A0ABR1RE76_9PEZI